MALKRVFDWQTLWLFVALFVLAMIPLLVVLLRQERTPQSEAEFNASRGWRAATGPARRRCAIR